MICPAVRCLVLVLVNCLVSCDKLVCDEGLLSCFIVSCAVVLGVIL